MGHIMRLIGSPNRLCDLVLSVKPCNSNLVSSEENHQMNCLVILQLPLRAGMLDRSKTHACTHAL